MPTHKRYALTALLAVLSMLATAVAPAAPAQAQEGCPDVIYAVFGAAAPKACRVAWCESRWRDWVVSATNDVGLFQINAIHGYHASTNAWVNTTYAYELSHGGTSWGAWSYPCNVA